ncbi:MAG: hypothetical protein OXD01_02465 [Gammaproteobacteria bacterium]|nr:hypothetical protein [Gammaproteobacteria bacterium]
MCEKLKCQRDKNLGRSRWPVEDEKLGALPSGVKLLMDTIHMIAYRAETQLMNGVATKQGKKICNHRSLVGLLKSVADIIRDLENGIL